MTENGLIVIPLKKPSEVNVIKPLTNLIKSKYNLGSSQWDNSEIIRRFVLLRNEALWRAFEKIESSLEIIYKYYDQICSLEKKIPNNELQVPFKWKDAFNRKTPRSKVSLTICSIKYEKICVMFNIASLQSAVASKQPMDDDKAQQLAAKLFQQAAGIYNDLQVNGMWLSQQELTTDLQKDTLAALSALMLAQAQEVFLRKAIYDSMKESFTAKLASQTAELFSEALQHFQKEKFSSYWDREWHYLIVGKKLGYEAMAEYYQSIVCNDKKLFGEEISRLSFALNMFKTAMLKHHKLVIFLEFSKKTQERLSKLQEENHYFHLEEIPDIKNLEPVEKVQVAKLILCSHPLSSNFRDMFSNLLPVKVEQALSSYEIRRNEYVNNKISQLRKMTQDLNMFMANLNLPAAIEDTSGTEIPQSLLEKAAAVRSAGGIKALKCLVNELPNLLRRNIDILNATSDMLQEEEKLDNQLREKFKDKWTRTPSAKLISRWKADAKAYLKVIDEAVEADKIIRIKFENNREGMEILSMDENHFSTAIPFGAAMQDSTVVIQLRNLMEDVKNLRIQRNSIESQLKSPTTDMKSIFLAALTTDGAIDEPNLSLINIKQTYELLAIEVHDSLEKQMNYIEKIESAHTIFSKEQSDSESSRKIMLCKLATAYAAFEELKDNLQEGTEFYDELTEILVLFQDKISDFCFARKTESKEMIKDLTTDVSNFIPVALPSSYSSAASTSGHELLQLPSLTNNSGPTTSSYVLPPMPRTYNPYSTMPRSRQQ